MSYNVFKSFTQIPTRKLDTQNELKIPISNLTIHFLIAQVLGLQLTMDLFKVSDSLRKLLKHVLSPGFDTTTKEDNLFQSCASLAFKKLIFCRPRWIFSLLRATFAQKVFLRLWRCRQFLVRRCFWCFLCHVSVSIFLRRLSQKKCSMIAFHILSTWNSYLSVRVKRTLLQSIVCYVNEMFTEHKLIFVLEILLKTSFVFLTYVSPSFCSNTWESIWDVNQDWLAARLILTSPIVPRRPLGWVTCTKIQSSGKFTLVYVRTLPWSGLFKWH